MLSSLSNLLKSLFLENSLDINVSLILPDFSEEEVSAFIKNIYVGKSLGSFSSLQKSLGISHTRSQFKGNDQTEYKEVEEDSTEDSKILERANNSSENNLEHLGTSTQVPWTPRPPGFQKSLECFVP